jgi:small conductance mechanosensitive channel
MEDAMDSQRIASWMDQAQPILIAFGLKVLGAIAVFIVGRWLIGMATRLVNGAMTRQKLDPTVQHYLVSFITIALNIILVVAILGYFGVETTCFAALVAGAGCGHWRCLEWPARALRLRHLPACAAALSGRGLCDGRKH